jgi:hypothetical protein
MKTCLLVAFSLLCLAFPVDSQQPLVGLIQGAVKNQQGAPVPNASVTATNLDTIEREWQASGTNSGGTFQIVDVPPGHYSIAVTNKDYQDYLLPFVTVHDGQTVNITIKMKRKDAEKLGAISQLTLDCLSETAGQIRAGNDLCQAPARGGRLPRLTGEKAPGLTNDPGAYERGAVYLPGGYPVRVPNLVSDEPTCRCRRAVPKLLRGNFTRQPTSYQSGPSGRGRRHPPAI